MPKATFESGTEIVEDSETIVPGGTWTDETTAGSEVFRLGPLVHIALRVTPKAREAWKKQKYKLGELNTEGGNVYEAIVAETDELKPTVNPAAWSVKKWKEKERVTFKGSVYEAVAAETTEAENPEEKPAEWKLLGVEGFQWKKLGTEASQKVICTLPREYWPAAVIKDLTTATVEVSTEGVVTALDALTAGTAKVYNLSYRAAGVSP